MLSKVTVDHHLMIYKLPSEVAIARSLSDHGRQIDRLLTTDFNMRANSGEQFNLFGRTSSEPLSAVDLVGCLYDSAK